MTRSTQGILFKKGEFVFRQGDSGDTAFIIESGQVQISIQKNGFDSPLVVLGKGQIFGEMAIIDGLPRSASAVAISEQVELAVISREQLFDRVHASDPVVRLLVSILIQRTRRMNESLSLLKGAEAPIAISTEDGEQTDEAIKKVKFENELTAAFHRGEFAMHYQPMIHLGDDKLVGFEALIRWDSPTLGRVRPDLFMNIVEESSLMIPVGRWIQERAMQDLAVFQKHWQDPLFMSINVSGRQFIDPEYFEDLARSAKKTGINPRQVKLEVTEKIFLDGTIAMEMIELCRQGGFKLSLDDFGTGYSSLAYLSQIQIDCLKIDQSFIRPINDSNKSQAIVNAIIGLTKELNIEVVAEGIETLEIHNTLAASGCELGQGYFYAKPMPAQDLICWIEKTKWVGKLIAKKVA